MRTHKITTNSYNTNLAFKQNNPASINLAKSTMANERIEPPKISNIDCFLNKITDEQIEQINKAKMLPENLRFEPLYALPTRNGILTKPIYDIVIHIPYLPTINKQTRILPKGFMVVRSPAQSETAGMVVAAEAKEH